MKNDFRVVEETKTLIDLIDAPINLMSVDAQWNKVSEQAWYLVELLNEDNDFNNAEDIRENIHVTEVDLLRLYALEVLRQYE